MGTTRPAILRRLAARLGRAQPHALPATALLLVTLLFVRLALANTALGLATLLLVGLAAANLGHSVHREAAVTRAKRRLLRLAAMTEEAEGRSLDSLISAIESHFAANEQRFGQRHRVTGLPTREPLLAQIAADGAGTLGVIAFPDVERLAAFDAAMADQLCRTLAERTRRMVARRLVAHVDRSQLAIWYGPDADPGAAATELDAIRYALSGAVMAGTREIIPEVRCGQAALADTGSPDALLARVRAVAALGTASGDDAAPADPIADVRDRFAIEQDLRQAIGRRQLALHYQPLIDAVEGRVCGAEALLRWHHPSRGLVPPSVFVPIMEEAGLAEEIGLWVLNGACREARRWQTAGLAGLRIAVNASAQQLGRADVQALVERTFRRHRLPATALEIELTESTAAEDTERTRALFDALRALGVTIAIDDFGTGFSSLTALRTLAFDKIKIDRQFVTDVDTRRDSQAICQSIIALGRGLNARVLAEGVERHEEYLWLRQHGCTHFQGFYFARPMTSAAFEAFVRADAALRDLLAVDPAALQHTLSKRLTA